MLLCLARNIGNERHGFWESLALKINVKVGGWNYLMFDDTVCDGNLTNNIVEMAIRSRFQVALRSFNHLSLVVFHGH